MSRVLVIGLDGATFDVIRPMVEAGRLPTLARLMRDGTSGALRSTLPPLTAPAWSSFITGLNPGAHGLIDFIRRKPGSYDYAPITAKDRQSESLWSMIGRQGKRVAVVNVPATYPPEAVNGLMVTGMLTPPSAPVFTYPPELSAELHRLSGGEYFTDTGWAYSKGGVERFIKRLYHATEVQVNAVKTLMMREPWDFFMYVFTGTDRMQHGLWHYMDATHPLHPTGGDNPHRDSIQRFYERVDRDLADFIQIAGDEALVIIMSDHGFGPFHKFIHVNNWLMKWGMLKVKNSLPGQVKHALFRNGMTLLSAYNILLTLGLGGMKGAVSKGRNRSWLRRFFLSFDDVDWSRTRAYSLGTTGQMYLNLQGREPNGIVPQSEYEQTRDELIGLISDMRDPLTNETIVEHVYRREAIYHGPFVERLPDLIFVPRGFVYNGFGEYEFGSRALVDVSQGITGWHRMDGVLIMAGGGIASGRSLEGARLIDLAPTILHLLGLGMPEGLDGRVLAEALTDSGAARRVESITSPRDTAGGLTDEETDEIVARLQDLGYLG